MPPRPSKSYMGGMVGVCPLDFSDSPEAKFPFSFYFIGPGIGLWIPNWPCLGLSKNFSLKMMD